MMEITETFIKDILVKHYKENYQQIYDNSYLIQYLDKKMRAVHGDSKTRRSLGNIYAIYSILHFYSKDFYNDSEAYKNFTGYEFTKLLTFCRTLYGGNKLQNHALNSRVNGEFKNKISNVEDDLIVVNDGKYLIHINYIYVDGIDISLVVCEIIECYISLLLNKDHKLLGILDNLQKIGDVNEKKNRLEDLLAEDAEARIFEIISYAILKNHYKNIKIYIGYSKNELEEQVLELYKTGRTNANDGGIDFVMRPLGRFFQVTEVNNYDKYLLDIDKVMHFPITFVIKTNKTVKDIREELNEYIEKRTGGMVVLKERYTKAIEEIITINELKKWMKDLKFNGINKIIKDIDLYYKLEMNIE